MAATPTEILGLFTIGHSNHTEEKFLGLLREHDIDVLVDVRSQPLSRYNPQFNSNNLKRVLAAGVCDISLWVTNWAVGQTERSFVTVRDTCCITGWPKPHSF